MFRQKTLGYVQSKEQIDKLIQIDRYRYSKTDSYIDIQIDEFTIDKGKDKHRQIKKHT